MNRNFMKFQNREIQGFDTDPDLWVDVLAQSWPSPVPRERCLMLEAGAVPMPPSCPAPG